MDYNKLKILLKKIKSIYGADYRQYTDSRCYKINIASTDYYMILWFTDDLRVSKSSLWKKDNTPALIHDMLDEYEVEELLCVIDLARQIIEFINESFENANQFKRRI